MTMSEVEILVETAEGRSRGRFSVKSDGKHFYHRLNSDPDELPIYRGDTITLKTAGHIDRRRVVSVSIAGTFMGVGLIIFAPQVITSPDPNKPFQTWETERGIVELRPGTTITGERATGFYDSNGVILQAEHVGGDPEKWEDWAYYVIAPSWLGKETPLWVSIGEIRTVVSAPESISSLSAPESAVVDRLLASGEKELFDYFYRNPERIAQLLPRQFEELVDSIYKNLGFATERIGAWNQEDGGVDIIAVSKTEAGTEVRLAIQCKASKNAISAKPIRELAGVLDAFKAHQGVVATTSRFTGPARRELEASLWKIVPQDRDALFRRIAALAIPDLKRAIDELD